MNFVVLATLAGTLASAQLNKVVQPAHDLARRQATATTAPTGGASSSASSPAATRTGSCDADGPGCVERSPDGRYGRLEPARFPVRGRLSSFHPEPRVRQERPLADVATRSLDRVNGTTT